MAWRVVRTCWPLPKGGWVGRESPPCRASRVGARAAHHDMIVARRTSGSSRPPSPCPRGGRSRARRRRA
jgi:hypothetical protein